MNFQSFEGKFANDKGVGAAFQTLKRASKGLLCKFVHVDVQLLLEREQAIWNLSVAMARDVMKRHVDWKCLDQFAKHTNKVNMRLMLRESTRGIVAVRNNTLIVGPPLGTWFGVSRADSFHHGRFRQDDSKDRQEAYCAK